MSKNFIWTFNNGILKKKTDLFQHYPYDHILKSAFSNRYNNIAKNLGSNSYSQNKKIKILDIGTFKLHNIIPFFKRGFKVYGTCINKEDLNHSLMYSKKNSIKINLSLGTNKKLNFPSNYFDLVLAINTFHYEESINSIYKSIKEIKRITKKNGLIFFDMPTKNYTFIKNCKKISKNIFIYKADKNLPQYNNKYFIFNSLSEVKSIFQKFFSTTDYAKISAKFSKWTSEFFHIIAKND